MLESALKRVNALAGCEGRLYNDKYGWFVIWSNYTFSESSYTAGELLAYLHGLEDALLFIKNKEKEL